MGFILGLKAFSRGGAGRHRQPRRRDAGRRPARAHRGARRRLRRRPHQPVPALRLVRRDRRALRDDPNLTLFGSNYQDVFAFLVLIAVLDLPPVGPPGRARQRPRIGDRACRSTSTPKRIRAARGSASSLVAARARRACRGCSPGSAPHGCASLNLAILFVLLLAWASTSSSASPGCSISATSRSTPSARTSTRCSRRRTSICICRSGSSCRSAPRSRASSACCSARRRLKLRGDYLAIVTLGFGEIIRIFLNNLSQPVNLTNGPQGITLIDPFRIGSFNFATRETIARPRRSPGPIKYYYFLVAACCIVIIVINLRLQNSAHRPRVGGDPRGRDRRARDGHQHAQHEAARVRDGRVVRRRLRRHLLGDAGLHQPRELRAGRDRSWCCRWSCSAAWATSGA